jgi:hypothetical protein
MVELLYRRLTADLFITATQAAYFVLARQAEAVENAVHLFLEEQDASGPNIDPAP